MFNQFSKKLELEYKLVKGRIENIKYFNSQCALIRYELSRDLELIKLHKNRITKDCYFDENLNILTQDFIYAVSKDLDIDAVISPTKVIRNFLVTEVLAIELSKTSDTINFQGQTVNYIQNSIDNMYLGNLGEKWVMEYEKNKLNASKNYNLVDKIKHIAIAEGDGTGFDIESYDNEGKKMFIEVKTTKGGKNSTFFITRNELERSKIENENYYLYRVYNFNEQASTAELLIIKGDLSNLCEFPTTYKINLI